MSNNEDDHPFVSAQNILLTETKVPNNQNLIFDSTKGDIRGKRQIQIRDNKKNSQTKMEKIWFWLGGNPFKKWHHSPGLLGFGFIFIITFMLIIIPYTGLSVLPALSSSKSSFNSTQALPWDESYSASASLLAGDKIAFNVSADNPVNVMIFNKSINNLPFTNSGYEGTYNRSFTNFSYSAMPFFLKKGDSLNYTFNIGNVSQNTDYFFYSFILDQNTLNKWLNGFLTSYSSSDYYNYRITQSFQNNSSFSASFTAPETGQWYILLDNSGNSNFPVSLSVHYNISALDLAQASVNILDAQNISQNSFTAPSSGTYTFLIMNPPSNSNKNESVLISTSGIFYKNLNANEYWKNSDPLLGFIALLFLSLLLITEIQRSKIRKKLIQEEQTKEKQKAPEKENTIECPSCKLVNPSENLFCEDCGTKLQKGQFPTKVQIQMPNNSYCPSCGSGLKGELKYCPNCGVEIK